MSSGLRKSLSAAGMALGLGVVLLVLCHGEPASSPGPTDGRRPANPDRQPDASPPARTPTEVEPGILVKDPTTGRMTAGGALGAPQSRPATKLFKLPPREVQSRESDTLAALAALEQAGKSLEREALAAAWARILASDPRRRSEFLRMLRATVDPELRRLQIVVLGRTDAPEAVQELVGLARTEAGAEMRSLVIQSLFQNGNPESGGEAAVEQSQLRPLSGREMSTARIQPLLELIGLERDHAVYQVLVELLGCYQDSSVYNGSDHPEITRAIIDQMRGETEPERCADLVSALRSTRSAEARDAILEVLNGTNDSRVLRSGLVALSAKEDSAASSELKLRLALTHDDASVRTRAMESLRVRKDERGLLADKIGPSVLRDSSEAVRLAGCFKLYQCGDFGKPFLQQIASSDRDSRVQAAARNWLAK